MPNFDLPRPELSGFPASPPIFQVPFGTRIYRIFSPSHETDSPPRSWDYRRNQISTEGRFDHLDPVGFIDVRSVWYGGLDFATCASELLHRAEHPLIRAGEHRQIVQVKVLRSFDLLDLRGEGPSSFPVRRGSSRNDDFRADHRLTSSRDYEGTHEWARAFHSRYTSCCGIVWPARKNSAGWSLVLNERLYFASDLAPTAEFPKNLSDDDLLWGIVEDVQSKIFFTPTRVP